MPNNGRIYAAEETGKRSGFHFEDTQSILLDDNPVLPSLKTLVKAYFSKDPGEELRKRGYQHFIKLQKNKYGEVERVKIPKENGTKVRRYFLREIQYRYLVEEQVKEYEIIYKRRRERENEALKKLYTEKKEEKKPEKKEEKKAEKKTESEPLTKADLELMLKKHHEDIMSKQQHHSCFCNRNTTAAATSKP